ncbi:hypothetical protein COV18_01665 [Candidatus Woesearchaeota archaeon CG10_big_fil_rev_8_21_14_0_10_37_12]|nr:MAG: hypothetical protein COV18_01665 [Candidatus Woesearchaeota archaeon CG10_big_fil_rev_8_21_14_0_10_37_12]
MRNFVDKLNKYFWYTKAEFRGFIIVVLALAFIYSWDQWGTTSFDSAIGLVNFIKSIIFVAITVFIHHSGQRIMALTMGQKVTHLFWWHGIIIGLILVLVSNGNIKFLAATGAMITTVHIHRLGGFRYGPNLTSLSKIAMTGPASNIIFAALIKSLEWINLLPESVSVPLFNLNLAFAAWNLLPIPPLDGSHILYTSRLTYIFVATTIITYILLAIFLNFYSFIIALLVGGFAWLIYLIKTSL